MVKKGPRGKISPSKTPASKRNSRGQSKYYEEESEDDYSEEDRYGDEDSGDDTDDYYAPQPKAYRESVGRGGPTSSGRKANYKITPKKGGRHPPPPPAPIPMVPKGYKLVKIGSPERERPSKKQQQQKLKKRPAPPEKQSFPPVSEMVIRSIKALKDNPRKGSTLGAIKETIALNWPVNMNKYDSKIKKFIQCALETGELIQPKPKKRQGQGIQRTIHCPRHEDQEEKACAVQKDDREGGKLAQRTRLRAQDHQEGPGEGED